MGMGVGMTIVMVGMMVLMVGAIVWSVVSRQGSRLRHAARRARGGWGTAARTSPGAERR